MTTVMNKYFPLTIASLQVGLVAGALFGLLTYSSIVALAVFTLFAAAGLTWRHDEAPVVPFIMVYQWSAISVGYLYYVATGIFPAAYAVGDLDRTATLSLSGLLALALGYRAIRHALPAPPAVDGDDRVVVGNLRGLFLLVMVLYGVNYVYVINTKAFGGLDAILDRVLDMRQVPLLLLWYEVVRQRTRMRYIWISLAWVFVPLLGSYFSDFKKPLFLLLIVSMSFWRPWEIRSWRWSFPQVVRGASLAAAILFLALVWQAGVKKETRQLYDRGLVASDPITRVLLFVENAVTAVPVVFDDTQTVVEGLVSRVSYITFFSRVLEHVPRTEPHARGELLQMAVTNTVMPRFLFPEKPVLPSDSYYTRRFTGIMVTEDGASISIGYMAEFYADWGIGGMFLSIFGYGAVLGAAAWGLRRFIRPALLVDPVLITVLLVAYQFEHQFIKTFAAVNISVIVALGTVALFRRPLLRLLDLRLLAVDEPAEAQPAPRRRYRTLPRVPDEESQTP